jgi:SAM-dependent methyltransferase
MTRAMIHGKSGALSACGRWLIGLLIAVIAGLQTGLPTIRESDDINPSNPGLHASEILKFEESLASANQSEDTYYPFVRIAFGNTSAEVLAFEENQTFIYLMGVLPSAGGAQDSPVPHRNPTLFRRLIFLKPSILIVDDEIINSGSRAPVEWRLYGSKISAIGDHRIRIIERDGELSCKTLFPQDVSCRLRAESPSKPDSERCLLETISHGRSSQFRFLHVLSEAGGSPEASRVQSALIADEEPWRLTISTEHRVFHLNLPRPTEGAGSITIVAADGATLLKERPLPAGILPHGPAGMRLLEKWDDAYHGKRPPAWDIGRPAHELQAAVREGLIRPCRIVDLCCGSGTDAVFLARHGFHVTGIDIAPSALNLAQQKAQQAGVSVQWLLADVLALPRLKPFDVIYDRGCYHVVRDQSLAAYLETIRRLSHPGTQLLLLASRRDEMTGVADPSGVTEEEIRYDFLSLFNLEWLRPIRLESNQPGAGPPGWSVLLRRKAKP